MTRVYVNDHYVGHAAGMEFRVEHGPDPPMVIPSQGVTLSLRLLPAGELYFRWLLEADWRERWYRAPGDAWWE